jgi:RNA polymerase sigma-70 factor, ECF subfamily
MTGMNVLETWPRPLRGWQIPTGWLRSLWDRLRQLIAAPELDLPGATDEQLVALVRAQNLTSRLAYGELVRRHQQWLVRFLLFLLHGRNADAEDIAQDVFVKAYLAMNSFRGDSGFRGWLRTIARRSAFDHNRDRRTAARYEEAAWESASVIDGTSRPPAVEVAATRQLVGTLLLKLAYPYREILVLRYLEHLPVSEIAHSLDIGVSAAKMRLKRAREQFEQLHAQELGDHDPTK